MSIVFVRHGLAAHNVAVLTEGEAAYSNPAYADARLLDSAKEAIQATGTVLVAAGLQVGLIVSSPLTRCLETAKILANHFPGISIACMDDLIECQGGGHICNQRRRLEDLEHEFPEVQFYCSDAADPRRFTGPRETYPEVAARMRRIIASLPTENILVVTHHDCIESITGVSLRNAEHLVIARKALGI